MGNRLRNCRDCNQLTYNVNKICSECFTKAKTKISDRLDSLHNMLKKYIYCEECIKQLEYYQNLKSCLCDHCVIIFDRLYGRFNNY